VSEQNSIQGYLKCLHDLRLKHLGEAESWDMSDFVFQTEGFTCGVHGAGCIVREDLGEFWGRY